MDIILLQAIEKLGAEGAVVRVKPGYARNFLIPRGMALAATSASVKAVEERARQQQKKQSRLMQQVEDLAKRIEALTITLKLNVGEDGQPFGSITGHALVAALKPQGITVPKAAVHLAQPIKTLGTHVVAIRVHAQRTASLTVQVVKA